MKVIVIGPRGKMGKLITQVAAVVTIWNWWVQ